MIRATRADASSDGEVVYPQFAYPLRKNVRADPRCQGLSAADHRPLAQSRVPTDRSRPIWLAALLAWIIPTAVFVVMQIRVRSIWRDLVTAEMALLSSLITAATFQGA